MEPTRASRALPEGVADLVVAGGGIAGLALALALRHLWPGADVVLCDPHLDAPRRSLRAVAVAAGPRRFLHRLGVWEGIETTAQPMRGFVITDSRPADAPRPVFLGIDDEAEPGEPFAHMVFHDHLRSALFDACRKAGVRLEAEHTVEVLSHRETTEVRTRRGVLRARLVVAADGARSPLREAAGIRSVVLDYAQDGIVATLRHDLPHEGRAVQHFLPGGPIALLPLRAEDGGERRLSLVWTIGRDEARRLVGLSRDAFAAELTDRVGREFGTLRLEDTPSAHPLRLVLPRRLVAGRLALLGDAARTIHPLAGQGLNLGLRDAAVLAELVADRLSLGLDPGDAETLASYQRARRFDGVMMAAATDGLNRLFSTASLPARLLRDLGLGLVDRSPALKRAFVRDAAGLAGRIPRLFDVGSPF